VGSWAHPRGAALIAAAVDARRAGYHRPLPVEVVQGLHAHYLRERGGMRLRPESWEDALAWAVEPMHATASLLIPDEQQRYLAFDYLVDAVDNGAAGVLIPDVAWETLISIADPVLVVRGLQSRSGEDHPGALSSRFEVAIWTGYSGDAAGSVTRVDP
jgi:hypothetical protein